MPTHVPVFVLTTWLLAMLPGAGQALIIRQSLTGGPARARATIAGSATGLLVWSTAAAAGLSAVLLAAPGAYQAVRVGGGIVLVVLGINTLRAARRPVDAPVDEGGWTAYFAGLATTLGNPKAGVFAVSVLPQFVTTDGPVLMSSIALGVVWALVNTCWYLLFTWALGRGRALVSRPVVRRGLSIATGVVLVTLGVAVVSGV
ncbi:LysE family translocator [Allokutzneria sp. A3M-2-11 16]|uniref:LysE family translocator n=1 Tax=Allokutzneria sp. A3M-2-11 16 TaxID=2962043 RepID=UPI0020B83EA2|nr:LysE family translocator [Allokutzneria sp. A3M-2-11 16]MCP3802925.1 LysE family translocator [Allokutzneria sp. A3M-2-11 16]